MLGTRGDQGGVAKEANVFADVLDQFIVEENLVGHPIEFTVSRGFTGAIHVVENLNGWNEAKRVGHNRGLPC